MSARVRVCLVYCVCCCDAFCRFSLFQLSRNHISFFLHVNVIQLAIFALFYYSIFTPFLSHANTITLNGDLTVVEHSHLIELHFNWSITIYSSFLSNYYKIKDKQKKTPTIIICFKSCKLWMV